MSTHDLLQRSIFLIGGGVLAAALVFGAGSAGLGTIAPAVAAPPPPTQGLEYVALGDSYSAGYGLTPPSGLVPGCAQSSSNYPHLLASALGLTLTDVTCSGAVAANITDTPQVTPVGVNPVQSDALSASTDIVTVTIGGNDLGFMNIATSCAALSPSGPTLLSAAAGSPIPDCKSLYFPSGGSDSLAAIIQGVVAPAVATAFATIREKAPNAKIFVLAYPALSPDADNTPVTPAGCFTSVIDGAGFLENSYPFTTIDVPYLNSVESQLDAAINTTSTGVGATFVSMLEQSVAHTPCASNPAAYINGITFDATSGIPIPTTPYFLTAGALHPNTAGAQSMADQALPAIEAAVTAPAITSGAPGDGTVGAAYSFAVTATGFPAPTFAVTAGALPAGLGLDAASGAITGTPTATGSSTFSITAANSAGEATSPSYTVAVDSIPTLTSGAPAAGKVGEPYSFTVTASGEPAPTFQVSIGTLPDGLSLDQTSGAITGTPTVAGSSTFTITATNVAGVATSPSYSLTVNAAVLPTPTPTPTPPTHSPTPPSTPSGGLAATGANPVPAGLAGLLVLLAGTGLLLLRRKPLPLTQHRVPTK